MVYTPKQMEEKRVELQNRMIKLHSEQSIHTAITKEKFKDSIRIIKNLKANIYYNSNKHVRERFRKYYVREHPDAMRYNNDEKRQIQQETTIQLINELI